MHLLYNSTGIGERTFKPDICCATAGVFPALVIPAVHEWRWGERFGTPHGFCFVDLPNTYETAGVILRLSSAPIPVIGNITQPFLETHSGN